MRLLEAQVLNVLVGNADCHDKNVSVVHLPDGTVRLSPVSDVMSTVVHHEVPTINGPKPLTRDLGMLIGDARSLSDVTLEKFIREATRWPLSRDKADDIVRDTIERIQ